MRELSDVAVDGQAEAFVSWRDRAGMTGLHGFTFWERGKDFAPEDLAAIRRAIVERIGVERSA